MLGAEQLAALMAWEEETKDAGIRFISSPSAWSAAVTRGDGWRHFLDERNRILDAIGARMPATKTVLLSGDVHFAMIAELRPGIYEVSASPISSLPMTARFNTVGTGENMIFTSQLRQHVARVDVVQKNGTANAVVSIFSEIPGLGPQLATRLEL